ncbi:MAG: phosphotransferase family protein [Frankia sp.]|nr:phosphotransferase family protein [Frankia sp.]
MPDVATDELVDARRLAEWAAGRLPGDGPISVERLVAGHSNLTFVVRRDDREWILRRPPRGPLLPTAHDVLREYRVLDLLGQSGATVRVPDVVAACDDASVIGAPFYLMTKVDGTVIRATLPPTVDDDADPDHRARRRALAFDLVDALAELHAVPVAPLVSAGIGRPDGYLERQLKRWRGQRDGARVRELPDYDAVSRWLGEHMPEPQPPAVVHGDYKLDNVIVVSGEMPRVAAIVDWEMATVGDPLADVGYLLSLWFAPGEAAEFADVAGAVSQRPGFPSRAELTARYEQAAGRSMTDIRFYTTLAVWKLAILLEASYARHLAGTTDDPFFALLDDGVPALLRRARETSGA